MSHTPLRKHRRPLRLACAALLLGACGRTEPPAVVDPLDARLATMDNHELAARTLAALPPDRPGDIDPAFLAELTTGAAGAVLVRAGDPAAAATVATLRAAAPFRLLVIMDLDAPAAHLPPARVLAAVGDAELLRRAGAEAAVRARALGADLGLVSLPPLNRAGPLPAVARDPERVAAGLAAYAAGAREGGLAIGLRALWNADPDASSMAWDRARLESLELRELRGLLEDSVAALALGSVRLPALTGDSLPLPISPAGPAALLRRDLAYDGLVIADLSPGSTLTRDFRPVDAAVAALAAGVDLLVGVQQPALLVDGIAAAVAAGRLRPERLREAARRVLRLERELVAADSLRVAGAVGDAARSRAPDAAFDTLPIVRAAARLAAARPGREADSLLHALDAPPSPGDSTSPIAWPPATRLEEASPASVGMRATLVSRIDALMREALADSVFSAAAVAVGRRGGLVMLRGYGRDGRDGGGDPVDPRETIFDLASLTKVVGTTTAVALLVDEGRMELDAPLERYLPRFDGRGKDEVRIRHLLTHTSGIPSGLWLFGSAGSADEALRQVLRQDLRREPGERVEYSDLGMILLAEAAEEAAGMPLDRFLALRVFAPLGMESTMYLPPAAFRHRFVPTAERTEREFALRGVVHDANAFRLGGIAGHAGLFSTAADLAVFARMMLNGGAYGTTRILAPGTVRAFTTRQRSAEQRALGWDTPSRVSSAGAYFSSRSFGHTGYTGTSLWADPETDLFVVLLTNRTYVKASGGEILRLRAAVHDAAARAISDRTIRRRPGAR